MNLFIDRNLKDGEIQALVQGLDVLLLPFCEGQNLRALPDKSGVYFLLDDSAILYVGQSQNMRARWACHNHRERALEGATRIAYLRTVNDSTIRCKIEKALISRFAPPLNISPGSVKDDLVSFFRVRRASLPDHSRSVSEWDNNGVRLNGRDFEMYLPGFHAPIVPEPVWLTKILGEDRRTILGFMYEIQKTRMKMGANVFPEHESLERQIKFLDLLEPYLDGSKARQQTA